LRQPVQGFSGPVKYPDRGVVDAAQRNEARRCLAVRKSAENKSGIDAGTSILDKLEVIQRATGGANVQSDMGARELLLVAEGKVLIGATLEPGRE
jgi:hypothetical protein